MALIRDAKPGTETELSYYLGDKLARKSVKLSPATVISTLPPEFGSEESLKLGPPGAERPLVSKVEREKTEALKPSRTLDSLAAELADLREKYENLDAQIRLHVDEIANLREKVRKLEAAAAPAEVEPAKPKPSAPRSEATKSEPNKLTPAKP
ncbi:MAG: hypothetical protein K8R36_14780 [Planctomycetales bacterium]|nr:hypothetical protein [Planctomycetales bacterium]